MGVMQEEESKPCGSDHVANGRYNRVDAKSLGELNKLVNCLKHNSTKSGPDLYTARPDFFDSDFDPNAIHPATGKPFTRIEWAENIALTDGDIEQFLTTVLNSAPK